MRRLAEEEAAPLRAAELEKQRLEQEAVQDATQEAIKEIDQWIGLGHLMSKDDRKAQEALSQLEAAKATLLQPTPTPAPTPTDPLAEIETLSLESRTGSKRAKEIVDATVSSQEQESWERFLVATTQEYGELTPEQRLSLFNAVKRRPVELDFRNQRHLRETLVRLCHAGEIDQNFLSEEDKLAHFVETQPMTWENKQKANAWQRAIDQKRQLQQLRDN